MEYKEYTLTEALAEIFRIYSNSSNPQHTEMLSITRRQTANPKNPIIIVHNRPDLSEYEDEDEVPW